MVGEHLCVGLRTSHAFDPLGGQPMFLRSSGAWDLTVGNVANEEVAERVLRLPGHRRAALLTNEFLPVEAVQQLL